MRLLRKATRMEKNHEIRHSFAWVMRRAGIACLQLTQHTCCICACLASTNSPAHCISRFDHARLF